MVATLRRDARLGTALLHQEFVADVKRVVGRLLGTDADHDDIVQQVFLNAFTSSQGLRDPGRLQAWVRSIAVHTVCRELRRRSTRRSLQRAMPPATHADLARDVEVRDLLWRTKQILDRMPRRERTVFILHELERYTVAELAQAYGWSSSTTKRRIAAAYARFHRLGGHDAEALPLLPTSSRSTTERAAKRRTRELPDQLDR